MKKTFAILSALVALMACTKVPAVVEEPTQDEKPELKVNITISKSSIENDTKATIKSDWADNDVVFVFFKGIATPKYLELKYNATEDTWTSTAKNGLLTSDLSGAADKKMTAIYLPYGNDYSVVASGGTFLLWSASNKNYSGHFYVDVQAKYTYEGALNGNLSLKAAQPASGKLVHFDITGHNPEHNYYMAQDYMCPFTLSCVNADGTIKQTVGHVGNKIPGYVDTENNIVSFSGILDESAVGESKNYRFVIHDKTDLTAYSRTNAGTKKISTNKYIGIGDITSANWTHITEPYFSVSPTKLVTFAPGNLIVNVDPGTGKNVYGFHANQYDITFKDQKDKFPEETAMSQLLATPNRDLFRWDEVAKYNSADPTQFVIGPGVTTSNGKNTYYTTVYESIDFGTINGHSDWHLCPDFVYLLCQPTGATGSFGKRGGSILACAVLTTENGFPDLYYMNGDRLGGTSGFFVFPDNWDDEWNTESINTRLNKPGTNYNVDSDDITMAKYSELIGHGAIFIPFNGIINDSDPNDPSAKHNGPRQVGNAGGSWSGSHFNPYDVEDRAIYPNLVGGGLTLSNPCRIFECRAVRLCRDLN